MVKHPRHKILLIFLQTKTKQNKRPAMVMMKIYEAEFFVLQAKKSLGTWYLPGCCGASCNPGGNVEIKPFSSLSLSSLSPPSQTPAQEPGKARSIFLVSSLRSLDGSEIPKQKWLLKGSWFFLTVFNLTR